jgi:hypothetical protein
MHISQAVLTHYTLLAMHRWCCDSIRLALALGRHNDRWLAMARITQRILIFKVVDTGLLTPKPLPDKASLVPRGQKTRWPIEEWH